MPAPILDTSSALLCPHSAKISHAPSQVRVLINKAPALTAPDIATIAGCPFQIPAPSGTKPSPCVTVQWLSPAKRVFANHQPVLLQISNSLCKSPEQAPQGPVVPSVVQPKVLGT